MKRQQKKPVRQGAHVIVPQNHFPSRELSVDLQLKKEFLPFLELFWVRDFLTRNSVRVKQLMRPYFIR
jgi:hypothetical protein